MTPYQRTMSYCRRYRDTTNHPVGCFDDKLWTECCAMVKR